VLSNFGTDGRAWFGILELSNFSTVAMAMFSLLELPEDTTAQTSHICEILNGASKHIKKSGVSSLNKKCFGCFIT
jgi:hypothetical protein